MPQLMKKRGGGQTAVTRIVTVCVLGPKAKRVSANAKRAELLAAVVRHVALRPWRGIHAVLLPGGFFRLGDYIGPLPFEQRVAAIEHTNFHAAVMAFRRELDGHS